MKKRMMLMLAMLSVFSLIIFAGCTPAGSGGSSMGSFSAGDIALTVFNTTVRPNDTVDTLLVTLGDGYEYSEAISCTYAANGVDGKEGMDKTFAYADACIVTYPLKAGGDYVNSIEVYDIGWQTPKGIAVGSTLQDITAAYGSDYVDDGGMIIYYADKNNNTSAQLYFVMEGDVVSIMGFVAGK